MAIFSKPIFGGRTKFPSDVPRNQRTCVTPKKGMLISFRNWSTPRKYDLPGLLSRSDKEWYLIVNSYVDDYGRCKFEFLGNDKTHWSEWVSIEDFNFDFEIKNPWI
jgi:hypothetical protein